MAEQFPKADVPKANNVHGTPKPPSGTHTPVNSEATIGHLGGQPKPAPTGQPAPNVHK